MNKILDVLLFPLTELVGWLIMRDLRRADWRYDMKFRPSLVGAQRPKNYYCGQRPSGSINGLRS